MIDVDLRYFEKRDEVRTFEKGRFELIRIGGLTVGRAIYEPGWKWSVHVAPLAGTTLCPLEHVGVVLAGTATAAFEDGRVIELRAGSLFHIPVAPSARPLEALPQCPRLQSRVLLS